MKHRLDIAHRPGTPPQPDGSAPLDRRAALKLLASGAALALASCGHPAEEIVPYVNIPDGMTPGIPMHFASALSLSGYARGVIVKSVEGRPIKIDGNPRHPQSLGATDIFAESAVLTLYDSERSKTPRSGEAPQSWSAFESELRARIDKERTSQGAGLRILTNTITSPTLTKQITDLLKSYPQARLYRYEPIDDDNVRRGAIMAFGRPIAAMPRLRDARVVLTLDADPLGAGPQQLRLAREFSETRQTRDADEFLRLYAVEPVWSLTGANADDRLPLERDLIRNVALTVAAALGAGVGNAPLPAPAQRFAAAVAADLKAHDGHALVLAGRGQPAEVHTLCHWINQTLHAPVDYVEAIDANPSGSIEALQALGRDIAANKVQTLIVLADNPVYDAPGDLKIGDAIGAVPFSAHLAFYDNETGARCTWHLPLSHPLESWSDLRAVDGTASIVQPLIRPLYDTRTAHQVLALFAGAVTGSSYDLVRAYWQANADVADLESWWRRTLQDGIVANSAAKPATIGTVALPQLSPAQPSHALSLIVSPDPSLWDGSFAENAWLQECPKPLTKEVWGNALHLSAAHARRLNVSDGDVVRLTCAQGTLEAPILVRPGQVDNAIAVTLGHGRTVAGAIGSGVGFDINGLRTGASPWTVEVARIERTGRHQDVLVTEHHFRLEGEARELQPRFTLAELAQGKTGKLPKPGAQPPTLYPKHDYDTYEWAMVIDTGACIGCNACLVACQSENNVPIVGPQEIAVGRDMHWLRIDSYFVDGTPGFSPIPCMQCEHAPCEPVCPVAASIHDSEGLNAQVYNRCVGTRFCESNCPYKVRRFNFFGYADGEEYKSFGAESVKAVFNPDVTVRSRGVMEKCTYCVQRISGARIAAEKDSRRIKEGEVVTACQAACPTRAISFGDLSDPHSPIHALRQRPESYALLGDLGTRPRTTYLARLSNPNDTLEEKSS